MCTSIPKPLRKSTTIRLEFELSAPGTNNYSEFNYAEELEKKKKELLKEMNNNEENTDFVKRLDQKYKQFRHCDIGMGYDDSDSFIDDTDCYDEIIPEGVEPVGGGFYINCGALEFAQAQLPTPETSSDGEIQKPSPSVNKFSKNSLEGNKKAVPMKTNDDHPKKTKTRHTTSHSGLNSSQLPHETGSDRHMESILAKATTVGELPNDDFSLKKFCKKVGQEHLQSDQTKWAEHQPKKPKTKTPAVGSSSPQLPPYKTATDPVEESN